MEQAGGGGGLGLGSLPEEVSCVQSQQRGGGGGGGEVVGLGLITELLHPWHAQLNPDQPLSPSTATRNTVS